jgi:type I restriction enzyme M protein
MKATRCYFEPSAQEPFFAEGLVKFEYSNGRNQNSHRLNGQALANAISEIKPMARHLEVSTASSNPLGVLLSALHLNIETPWGKFSLERLYQSSKVFERGGPFRGVLDQIDNPKSLPSLKDSGKLLGFEHPSGKFFPADGTSKFYDHVYIEALLGRAALLRQVSQYDLFTDLRFSKHKLGFDPDKPFNTQARACAIASSLFNKGGLSALKRFHDSNLENDSEVYIQPELF